MAQYQQANALELNKRGNTNAQILLKLSNKQTNKLNKEVLKVSNQCLGVTQAR